MKKRTAQRVDSVSEGGFARFLSIAHSLANQGLISLSVGEPDFKTPWHICEAAIEAMKKGFTGYTPTSGYPELLGAVARYLENRYGIKYNPDTEIVITVGSSQAMDLAFRATVDPGDEVILSDPITCAIPLASASPTAFRSPSQPVAMTASNCGPTMLRLNSRQRPRSSSWAIRPIPPEPR